jgi:phage terminase large subunit-like protein
MKPPREFGRVTPVLIRLSLDEVRALIARMSPADLLAWDADFESWVQQGQIEPADEGWRTWLMMAGRGYGKTRAGAEWITRLAAGRGAVRIALVGATDAEVRKVMIEGESGLLAVGTRYGRRPAWEPGLGRLRWPGGSIADVFSAEAPERLRGPQHHFAWCDELAKWASPEATWDNLQMTLRAGVRPRTLVTTTPRAIPLLKRIEAQPWTVRTGGRSADNATLPPSFLDMMAATYGGTRLGRQELDGELVEDLDGALWTRALIEQCRVPPILAGTGRLRPAGRAPGGTGAVPGRHSRSGEELVRVVVGVDPPATAAGDACGIVVCALGADGLGYVLADRSAGGLSPEGWAGRVAATAEAWGAERVAVENNQGGEMVESVLRAVDPALPVRPVRARYGKSQRAEPVAILFERGRARFAGAFPELEDELAGMTTGGAYLGPGRSPDRADAMVWALTELMLGKERAEPRIRRL